MVSLSLSLEQFEGDGRSGTYERERHTSDKTVVEMNPNDPAKS